MEHNIILSICIPTYNRSSYLETTILSIVNQRRFQESNDVEIIISDNCSEDNTREVSEKYIAVYGEKIRYYRNSENIKDMNFEKVLSYGQGLFLKLNNDTLKHHDQSIDKILQTIDKNRDKRNILFFLNGELSIMNNVVCDNLSSFVDTVSYYSGWMGAYGIWKEDFVNFTNYNRCTHLQLTQVDVLFKLINSKRAVFVNNDKLFISVPLMKKGGYDFITVFLDNYIFILTEQLDNKTLSKKIFIEEKRKLLLQFIRPWLIIIILNPKQYYWGYKNWFRKIVHYYKNDILTLITFIIYFILSFCYHFVRKSIHFPDVINNKLK